MVPRCQMRWHLDLGRCQNSRSDLMGVNGEELEQGYEPSRFPRIAWDGLVAIDADEEAAPMRQVHGHSNAMLVSVSGLIFPEPAFPSRDVGTLIPDDRQAVALAVLHDGITPPSGLVFKVGLEGRRDVLDADERRVAARL